MSRSGRPRSRDSRACKLGGIEVEHGCVAHRGKGDDVKTLTVFTPTYNRRECLKKSYEALCGQTCGDFVWLIVDDGSTDGTADQVRRWQDEGLIEIGYVYQENHGKQRAVNTGVTHCATPWFGFLDSDDYYLPNTVERFLADFETIGDDGSVAGVLARRGTDVDTVSGPTNVPEGRYVMSYDALVRRYRFHGETCRAYRTEVLRRHLYPEIEDKFIPEDVMLSAIDQDYDLLIDNRVFSISRYLDNGYTMRGNVLFHENPTGYALGLAQLAVSRRGILWRAKYTVLLLIWCRAKGIPHPESMLEMRALSRVLAPASCLLYLVKRPTWFFEEG